MVREKNGNGFRKFDKIVKDTYYIFFILVVLLGAILAYLELRFNGMLHAEINEEIRKLHIEINEEIKDYHRDFTPIDGVKLKLEQEHIDERLENIEKQLEMIQRDVKELLKK